VCVCFLSVTLPHIIKYPCVCGRIYRNIRKTATFGSMKVLSGNQSREFAGCSRERRGRRRRGVENFISGGFIGAMRNN